MKQNLIKHSHIALARYITDMQISVDVLAKKTNISENKIKKALLEDGEFFKYNQLAKISEVLYVPMVYLTLEHITYERPVPIGIEYRNHIEHKQQSYQEQALISYFSQVRQDYIGIIESLEQEPISFQLKLSGINAEQDAKKIIQYFDIHQQARKVKNNDDYYNAWREIIELKDVLVLEKNRTSLEADGMCLYFDTIPVIAIFSSNQSPARKLFTLIHELVHLGLGNSVFDGHILDTDEDIERYCNCVAGYVLAPKETIDSIYVQGLPLEKNVQKIRAVVKASKIAIAIQLKQLSYISQKELSIYIEQLEHEQQSRNNNSSSFSVSKDIQVLKHFGFNFVEKVMSAMWQQQISTNTAKQILGLKNNDRHHHAFNQLQDKVF